MEVMEVVVVGNETSVMCFCLRFRRCTFAPFPKTVSVILVERTVRAPLS